MLIEVSRFIAGSGPVTVLVNPHRVSWISNEGTLHFGPPRQAGEGMKVEETQEELREKIEEAVS